VVFAWSWPEAEWRKLPWCVACAIQRRCHPIFTLIDTCMMRRPRRVRISKSRFLANVVDATMEKSGTPHGFLQAFYYPALRAGIQQ
jgi:hypothetical protein